MAYFRDEAHFEYMGQFAVRWCDLSDDHLDELRAVIDGARREEDVQAAITKQPRILANLLRGGHGRYVLPKARLGSEYVTDYLLGEAHSFGFSWLAVELESPTDRAWLKDGNESEALRQALQQIRDWRAWLIQNIAYAQGSPPNGLGLCDLHGDVAGLVLIGRRAELDELSPVARQRSNAVRRDLRDRTGIEVHTYDWLVEVLSSSWGSRPNLVIDQAEDAWERDASDSRFLPPDGYGHFPDDPEAEASHPIA